MDDDRPVTRRDIEVTKRELGQAIEVTKRELEAANAARIEALKSRVLELETRQDR